MFSTIKYAINDFFGVDYETLSHNIASSPRSTHNYIINYVSNELTKLRADEVKRFKNRIKDLKQFREDSDYEDTEITSDKGIDAFRKAEEIRRFLITNFHL